MDRDDLLMLLLFFLLLGAVWGIPKEDVYNGLVTLVAALIAGGYLLGKRKRK